MEVGEKLAVYCRIKCTNLARWLFTVGMTKKNSPLSKQEKHLLQLLREHPEMMERFRSILELAASKEGPVKSADEVEALLIEEVRRLGKTAMGDWALNAERRLGEELAEQDATASVRKKNAEVVVRVWADHGERTGVAHGKRQVCPAFV